MTASEAAGLLAHADALAAAGRVACKRVFSDLEGGRALAATLPATARPWRLVGAALARSQLDEYLAAVQRFQTRDADRGVRYASYGVEEVLALRAPLPTGGVRRGYEVLGTGAGEFHSWHCHALERQLCTSLGTRLISGGLIPSHAQACRIAEFCDRPEHGCEPGVWRAWALVEYPLAEHVG
jgi:hypothetical protein